MMALISVMGIFVADLAFKTPRLPNWGETVLGRDFRVGPGGKGSNQSVVAARAGGRVAFITKLGEDPSGLMAREMYAAGSFDASQMNGSTEHPTGGAAILVDHKGENAIVVKTAAT